MDTSDTSSSDWAPAERATGWTRAQWLDFFGSLPGSADMPHTELAQKVLAQLEERALGDATLAERNLAWWAQGVTVLFEQHIGRRALNQRCDGTFGTSASKTVPGNPADIADAWTMWAKNHFPLPLEGQPRRSSTEKWEYWRATGSNGAALSVNINSRAAGKTTLAAEVKKLGSAEQSAEYKALFKDLFAEFARFLSSN